jgi:hypothetical protein
LESKIIHEHEELAEKLAISLFTRRNFCFRNNLNKKIMPRQNSFLAVIIAIPAVYVSTW